MRGKLKKFIISAVVFAAVITAISLPALLRVILYEADAARFSRITSNIEDMWYMLHDEDGNTWLLEAYYAEQARSPQRNTRVECLDTGREIVRREVMRLGEWEREYTFSNGSVWANGFDLTEFQRGEKDLLTSIENFLFVERRSAANFIGIMVGCWVIQFGGLFNFLFAEQVWKRRHSLNTEIGEPTSGFLKSRRVFGVTLIIAAFAIVIMNVFL